MKIAIVGAGAIGSRIAAHLSQSDTTCTLVDAWAEHVDALNRDGLRLRRKDLDQRHPVRAFTFQRPPTEKFDIVLLAVRSDATANALPLVQDILAPDGFVVSCQNGLNEEEIAKWVGAERTAGCSMIFGARLTAPAEVTVLEGPDTLRLGEFKGAVTPRITALAKTLSACGTVSTTDNLLGYRWMKLVLNATGNPLLLLSGLDGESLHDRASARRLIIALTSEIMQVALCDGAQPEPLLEYSAHAWTTAQATDSVQLHEALQQHGKTLGKRRLSMVADFEARGRTEIGEITGKVVEKALRLRCPAPLNAEILRHVRAVEAGVIKPGLTILDALASEVI